MEDDNSMSERILRSLETIIKTDPELKEFDVIPAEINSKNKSPVIYQEHNIGLESWCIKHIYRYAYLELFEVRKQLSCKKLSYCKEHRLNHLLIGVLLINPDVATFWNMKRELVERDVLSLENELLFSKLVLSYKSKSNEAFAYRRWLIRRILSKTHNIHVYYTLLQNELSVCEMTSRKSQNNYHSWNHRIWCMEVLGEVSNTINELEFSYQWTSSHISEHTSYHYRQYLINSVKNQNINLENYYRVLNNFGLMDENDPRNILTFMLGKSKPRSIEEAKRSMNFICLLLFDLYNTVEFLNNMYPNHESIWYHRRYLLYSLIKILYDYHGEKKRANCEGEKQAKLFKSQPSKVESSFLYQTVVKNELRFIKENSEQDLAKRYEKWLKSICVNLV